MAQLQTTGLAASQGVAGTVEYEKIPATPDGLRIDEPVRRPAAGVTVEAILPASGRVAGRATTDENGSYAIRLSRPASIYVRVLAQAENARVLEVEGDTQYALRGPDLVVGPGEVARADLLAADSNRASGPFNILATIRRANAFLRAVQPRIAFPPVNIRWAPSYSGLSEYTTTGEMLLVGRRDINSDEFDDNLILHEYGHFVEKTFSRTDTPGGEHGVWEAIDPRLAWSEGWANFFSCAVLGDPYYISTYGSDGSVVDVYNVEKNRAEWYEPGYWNEVSVASILWDIFDADTEEADPLALGFAPIWEVMTGPLKRETLIYLVDFSEAWVRADPSVGPAFREMLNERSISYTPGGTPPVPIPFPLPLRSGVPAQGALDSFERDENGEPIGDHENLMTSKAWYDFTLSRTSAVTLEMRTTGSATPETADLDLVLVDVKQPTKLLAYSAEPTGVGGQERIEKRLRPGHYAAVVVSYYYGNGQVVPNSGSFELRATYGRR
jgi:hypothetical protein